MMDLKEVALESQVDLIACDWYEFKEENEEE